jgi:hypothetical protein
MTTQSQPSARSIAAPVLRILIICQGVFTLFASLLLFPVGIAFVLVNLVVAFIAKGVDRRLCLFFAVAGVLLNVVAMIFFPAVSSSVTVEPPTRL